MSIHTLSAYELHKSFCKGELKAEQIIQAYLDRIERYNKDVGAFLRTFDEKALSQAKALDEKFARGEKVGRLAGVPIALKDNMHIKGELSTCGSKFLTNFNAPFDATVTRLLENEDAIILGKTNLDEFAMGSSTEMSALAQTHNPWDLSYSPGGSSGGSAAAVAARLCPIALGSDTGGSIRQPASFCGVCGYKPTYGRVSRFGLVAFGSSLDQIGPFATTTQDVAMVMEVLGQHCEKDSTSCTDPSYDFLSSIGTDIKGLKVGVPRHFIKGLKGEAKACFDKSLETLQDLGAELVDVDLEVLKYSIAIYYILATAEASTNLARFDGVRYGVRSESAQTLDDVYDLSKQEGFGPEVKRRILLGTFVLSAGYQDAYYKKAQKVRTLLIRKYQEAFKKCDVVATPVTPDSAFKSGSIKDPLEMYFEDMYTIGVNLAGLPGISVPAGFINGGKPYGLQIVGPQKADVAVCQTAYAFEKATACADKIPEQFKK